MRGREGRTEGEREGREGGEREKEQNIKYIDLKLFKYTPQYSYVYNGK